MRTLNEVRAILNHNIAIEKECEHIRETAESEINKIFLENYIELTLEEEVLERQLGVCNYLRSLNPEKFEDGTDQDIIDYYNMLENKYGGV